MIRKSLLLLTALASLSIANSRKAALGWTLAECKQHLGVLVKDPRQGEIVDFGRKSYVFSPKGFYVTIWIEQDGTVGRVAYLKKDMQEISPGEAEALMTGNSKSTWGAPILTTDQTMVQWETNDGVCALYTIADHMLTIYNPTDASVVNKKHLADAQNL